jgi:cytochrome bd-type quinol oxidase subunit 2
LSKIVKSAVNILGWIILMAAFASLGFSSDDPAVGVPVFLAFFILVFALTYLYIKNHQRHQAKDNKYLNKIKKVAGMILLLLALFTPYFVFRSANLPFISYLIVILIDAILIALGAFAITLINSEKAKNFVTKLLGYVILIIISAIPAILMISYDSSYNALGMAYYTAVLIAVFSWWGFSLFSSKE